MTEKRNRFGLLEFGYLFTFLILGTVGTAQAAFNVDINFGAPPVFYSEPPEVVLMPESGVYFVPGSVNVFFYNGFWWSSRSGHWFRSDRYNGSWVGVRNEVVPDRLNRVPHNYRDVYRGERRINYGQWKNHHNNVVKEAPRVAKNHDNGKAEDRESKRDR